MNELQTWIEANCIEADRKAAEEEAEAKRKRDEEIEGFKREICAVLDSWNCPIERLFREDGYLRFPTGPVRELIFSLCYSGLKRGLSYNGKDFWTAEEFALYLRNFCCRPTSE